MFQVGQWVSYKQTAAYIVEVNEIEKRYLIHIPTVFNRTYWIPGDYLNDNEEVQLMEEDIRELKLVAMKTGDFAWYRALSRQHN